MESFFSSLKTDAQAVPNNEAKAYVFDYIERARPVFILSQSDERPERGH
jgi:hypothetical protein